MAGKLQFLPQFQGGDQSFQLLQNAWGSILNAVIGRQQNNSLILPNVALIVGTTVINHRLGQKLQGWKIVRKRGLGAIYDVQDANPTPALTLNLVSDTAVVIDLEVF